VFPRALCGYNHLSMPTVLSFAKINLCLAIGLLRPDAFHELRTAKECTKLGR
jgi:4-diphosphocytidyl-2C-methyl-D-erythritol kinase